MSLQQPRFLVLAAPSLDDGLGHNLFPGHPLHIHTSLKFDPAPPPHPNPAACCWTRRARISVSNMHEKITDARSRTEEYSEMFDRAMRGLWDPQKNHSFHCLSHSAQSRCSTYTETALIEGSCRVPGSLRELCLAGIDRNPQPGDSVSDPAVPDRMQGKPTGWIAWEGPHTPYVSGRLTRDAWGA